MAPVGIATCVTGLDWQLLSRSFYGLLTLKAAFNAEPLFGAHVKRANVLQKRTNGVERPRTDQMHVVFLGIMINLGLISLYSIKTI